MNYKWYAIYVTQGKEFYVKDKLDVHVNNNDTFNEVLLPTMKEVSEVRRKKIVKNIPVYPSYLFIHANLTNYIRTLINDTIYVINFLGVDEPLSINEQEMEIVKAIASDNNIRSAFKYKIGDMIEILGGHCKGLSGRVIDIVNVNNVKVEIQIFNRAIYASIKLEDIKIA